MWQNVTFFVLYYMDVVLSICSEHWFFFFFSNFNKSYFCASYITCLTGGTGINLTPPPLSIVRFVKNPILQKMELFMVMISIMPCIFQDMHCFMLSSGFGWPSRLWGGCSFSGANVSFIFTLFHYIGILIFLIHWTSKDALERCKERIELIANTLQLEGFSRIDAFVNVDSGEVFWFHYVREDMLYLSAFAI